MLREGLQGLAWPEVVERIKNMQFFDWMHEQIFDALIQHPVQKG